MGDPFDPARFVDREFEQELFRDLLQFRDDARILTIRDESGMGKSHVLKMLRYQCRVQTPRIAVALVDLKQLSDLSPLAIIKEFVKELEPFKIDFPEFARVEGARICADFSSIRGAAYFEGSKFDHARDVRIAGVMYNVETADLVQFNTSGPALTREQEEAAQDVSLRSFCGELDNHCNEQPLVLLIDSLELAHDERFRKWLLEYFLERHCFDAGRRPQKLIIVLAGQDLPRLELQWSSERCDQVVKSVKQLGRWTREHVSECLRVHGFKYEAKHIETFYHLTEMGLPPSQIIQAMRACLQQVA